MTPLDHPPQLAVKRNFSWSSCVVQVFAFALGWLVASVARAAPAMEPVVLQLKYRPQFQFAGYYAALEKGYYRDAGLQVEIRTGSDGEAPVRAVLAGQAQFGTGSSSLLRARAAGKPLVVLAAIFQHSPYALLMRGSGSAPDVRTLIGKRVMLGSVLDEMSQPDEVMAFLQKSGVTPSSLVRVEHSFDTEDLVRGRVDAMSVYVTNELEYMERQGQPYQVLHPRSVGIDFYGDNLFTSERELAEHPQRVHAFRAASLRGWQYAMAHQQEIAEIIARKYARQVDTTHLLYEARQMVPLVQPLMVEMGYMNPERWRRIADVYAELGLLPRNVSLDGFLYDAQHGERNWLTWVAWGGVMAAAAGALLMARQLASERRRAREAIRRSEQRFRTMFEAAPTGIALIDMDNGCYQDINPAYADIAGRALQDLVGRHWMEIYNPDDLAAHREQLDGLEASGPDGVKFESRLLRADGCVIWAEAQISTVGSAQHPYHMCMLEDVTERKEAASLIWRQANYDTLTHLPNRQQFQDRLRQAIARERRGHRQMAVMFIDLDHFKEVNDALGHDQGDALLREVASRIAACVRQSDTVARLGGDEFTVLLCELTCDGRVQEIAQQIIARISSPIVLGQELAYVSASVGITMFPADGDTVETLLKNADQAMYAAKGNGRNCYRFYSSSMQAAALSRMRLGSDLRRALEGDELRLYVQPIEHLSSGTITKAEALIRWEHPQRGMVSPAEFIPLAESNGLIAEIGEWVFQESLRWLQRWRQQVYPEFQLSLNQSPLEFQRERRNYANWVAQLERAGVPGRAIVIELTEGLLMETSATVANKLAMLREAGIQIALDDFGTGYSSLSYLTRFPIDFLKIDRSFTNNLMAGSRDMALSEAIVVMAHRLGLRVIAEGVETAEQRSALQEMGCDYGQGYLMARPLPVAEFDQLLRQRTAGPIFSRPTTER